MLKRGRDPEGKGANDWNQGFLGACRGGHLPIIKLMISKGVINLCDNGLAEACFGGHLPIVELMIKKGADNWSWGFKMACRGGSFNIVKLMLSYIREYRGIKSLLCLGFNEACRAGNITIVKLMVSNGVDDLDYGLDLARSKGHHIITQYLAELIARKNN